MAFNHTLMATEGLYPGMATVFSFALLGAGSYEIVVVPPQPKKNNYGYSDLQYKIIIRVKKKDKVWEQSRYVSYFSGKSIEKIVSSFNKISNVYQQAGVKATLINRRVKEIFVGAKNVG